MVSRAWPRALLEVVAPTLPKSQSAVLREAATAAAAGGSRLGFVCNSLPDDLPAEQASEWATVSDELAGVEAPIDMTLRVGLVEGAKRARLISSLGEADGEAGGVVRVDEYTANCIHPEHVTAEVVEAAGAAVDGIVDSVLLVNPEDGVVAALAAHRRAAAQAGSSVSEADLLPALWRQTRHRLQEAFVALEVLRRRGLVRRYGVSSEALGERQNSPLRLQHEELPGIAAEAARRAAMEVPDAASIETACGFGVVEVAGNLVERQALSEVGMWAQERGAQLLAMRPLTARSADGVPVPLATAPSADEYAAIFDGTMQHFGFGSEFEGRFEEMKDDDERNLAEACAWLRSYLRSIHDNLPEYSSPQHWEHDLMTQVAPTLRDRLGSIDSDSAALLTRTLDAFSRKVAADVSDGVREHLRAPRSAGGLGYGTGATGRDATERYGLEPLGQQDAVESYALRWLGAHPARPSVVLPVSSIDQWQRDVELVASGERTSSAPVDA